MKTRKPLTGIALALSLAAPAIALADGFWIRTNDEAGHQVAPPRFGEPYRAAPPRETKPLAFGDVSADRQFVYLGEAGGWQLRPMQYVRQGGRLVHVDDPVGHMHREADRSPLTEQERIARQNSAGN